MSQAVIFAVGTLVFAVTVWGTVMAGGHWLDEIAKYEDKSSEPGTGPPASPGPAPSP